MQYRKDKYGNDISALGYGCMRFTKKGNSADLDKAEKEVIAIDKDESRVREARQLRRGSIILTLPTCMPEMKWQWEKFYTGIIAGRKSTLPQSFRII